MSIPHTTSRDVTFQEYFIKKGTSVIPLLMFVLQDNSEWESPHSFNPSHFLDEQNCGSLLDRLHAISYFFGLSHVWGRVWAGWSSSSSSPPSCSALVSLLLLEGHKLPP
ncbi:unnamed protein product [Oncorhynchus mykiss]|uniref:Uncharacterized protein n=1 Tax=Oncorhynchus mykiss TaxID=8022 RepID=A0A060YKL6_ONCMY|nr:unnamed protein product [Oncorhynchus mykiss]